MQFSDSAKQKQSDAEKIFARAVKRHVSWVTGTEAGQQELRQALTEQATRSGYRFFVKV